jgi:malonate transporter
LVFAPTVPIINMMCVAVLSVWGSADDKPDVRRVALRIAANPLILACLAGITANAMGWFQSGPMADTAALAGRAALPMILLAIGAGLDFTALRARPALLTLSTALKLVVAPLVFIGLGLALGVEGMPLALLAAIGATPGAAAAYVLASEMGGDARLMAGHVTATTLLAFIALPFWIGLAS